MALKIIRKNSCKGIIVAFKADEKIFIGHSMCRSGDKFDRAMGYSIAMKRAISTHDDICTAIPESASAEYDNLLGRVYRYFKFTENSEMYPQWYRNFVEETPEFVEFARSKKDDK